MSAVEPHNKQEVATYNLTFQGLLRLLYQLFGHVQLLNVLCGVD